MRLLLLLASTSASFALAVWSLGCNLGTDDGDNECSHSQCLDFPQSVTESCGLTSSCTVNDKEQSCSTGCFIAPGATLVIAPASDLPTRDVAPQLVIEPPSTSGVGLDPSVFTVTVDGAPIQLHSNDVGLALVGELGSGGRPSEIRITVGGDFAQTFTVSVEDVKCFDARQACDGGGA